MADAAASNIDAVEPDDAAGGRSRPRRVAPLVVAALAVVMAGLFVVLLTPSPSRNETAATPLLGRPALVIADEPTSALDAALRDGFMALMLEACRDGGSTLVFVSHDERLADRFDRCVALPALNRAVGAGAS